MSKSYDLPKLTSAQTDVDLPVLDRTKLKRTKGPTEDISARSVTTNYIMADGDSNVPVGVDVVIRDDKPRPVGNTNDNPLYRRHSFALSAILTETDSVTDEVETWNVVGVLALNVEQGAPMTVALARRLLGNLYSVTIESIAATVITEGPLTDIAFGITDKLEG